MKSIFSSAALVFTFLTTTTHAASYRAICIFDQAKCGGAIRLREYSPLPSCSNGECSAFTDTHITTFSTLETCTDDHIRDTDKHLKGNAYVLVDTFGSGCTGDLLSAVAVTANGKCYPGSTGTSSYIVTMKDDRSVTWTQFMDANCSRNATEMSFKPSQVDGSVCVQDTMKVMAVKANGAPTTSSSSSLVVVQAAMPLALAVVSSMMRSIPSY